MLRVRLKRERWFNIEFCGADSHFCHSAYVTWSHVELWSAYVPARLSHFRCRTHFVRRDVCCRALCRCCYQLFPEIEEMLIEKLCQRTFLYDAKSPDYRDQHMRASEWEGTGKELKINCKFYVFTCICEVSSRDVRIVCPRPNTWHDTCPMFHNTNMKVTCTDKLNLFTNATISIICQNAILNLGTTEIQQMNHRCGNAMWWGTRYARIMKWYAVKLVQHWPYQPSAEQQMQTVCGTLATCPPLALTGWESVVASSLCAVGLPPDVTDCSVLQTRPDLLYHLPTPSLLCTENITSLGDVI